MYTLVEYCSCSDRHYMDFNYILHCLVLSDNQLQFLETDLSMKKAVAEKTLPDVGLKKKDGGVYL